jgi:hypothetical protein
MLHGQFLEWNIPVQAKFQLEWDIHSGIFPGMIIPLATIDVAVVSLQERQQ